MLADTSTDHPKNTGNSMTYSSVSKFALNGLSDLIRVLMENIDDALFDLSEKAESDSERSLYFEAMREIRIKRSLLQLSFDHAMEDCFETLTKTQSSNVVQLETDELSLVELEDLEDSIAIDNMISKARPGFEDDLFAVLERLKAVLHRKEIDEDTNPFDPKAICNSFHKASEILETDIQIKLIFYKLFDKYVINNLGHFYNEMNDYFIDKGVLPGFKASDERLKQTTKFMANRIKRASQQSANSLPHESIQSPDNAAANDGLLSVLQQAISSSAGAQIPSSAPTDNYGAISNSGHGADISILPVAQNSAYMSALTNLQMSGIQSQPVFNINPESFRQEMHQQLVAFNQENSHQTNTADSQIIDIVSMLFDFFLDDATLPTPIKVLIGRLQIPILKAAIIDNDFFNHKKHPARQLLDCISKASLGWGEGNTLELQLTEKIESIVNYVLNEFDQDITVFSKALGDLTHFIEAENKNIEIANEIIIQQEQDKDRQIDEAQHAAAKLISKIGKNRDLSFEVSDFLETIWTSVLFHTYLSLGESSNHWKNLRRITSTLIWTLVPKFSEEERVKILRTLPALLRALSKGMELVKIGADAQNRIFRMLAKEHAKVVKQTSKNIVTRVDDQTVWPEDRNIADAFAGINVEGNEVIEVDIESIEDLDPDSITIITESPTQDVIQNLDKFTKSVSLGEIEVDEEIVLESSYSAGFDGGDSEQDDEFSALAESLKIGDWVEFQESGSEAINTRLSWKSNITGKMVFVNRQGAKVRNLSVNALAIELRSERARLIESSSVFDRAINTIMTSIKH
ncbi:MAG: DUF1631 domain-containing protein [Gammaproteobacteria bacterium]|nr:DUF1631 domain-containing protein [Gammaproteobacteria bacterium]